MKRLMTLALAATFVAPAAVAAQPATSIAVNCDAGAAKAGSEATNLHGHWDFLIVLRGTPISGPCRSASSALTMADRWRR